MAHPQRNMAASCRQDSYPTGKRDPSVPRLTRNERKVYDTLLQRTAPAKAYDLLEVLREDGLRSPMSIYRALDALARKGMVKKVVSLNAFSAVKPDSTSEVSAFMTCQKCQRTTTVELGKEQVEAIFGAADMTLREVYIEAHGQCDGEGCRNARFVSASGGAAL